MAINRFDKDEELSAKSSFSYLPMLTKYLVPYKKKIALVILIMFANAFFELLPPYFISIVLDKCLPEKNFTLLYILSGALVVSFILSWVCQRLRPRIAHTMSMDIIKQVRSDLFCHIQKLPVTFFDTRPHGKIVVRVVNYINSISNLLSNGIFDMITNVFKLFVILIFMFLMDAGFTFICLAGMPIFIAGLFTIKSYHGKAARDLSSKNSNLNAYIQESISGMKITQSFAREKENAKVFDTLCQACKKTWMKCSYIANATPRFVNIISTGILIIIYAVGSMKISGGTLTVGALIGFASYIGRFWDPIAVLASYYSEIVNCSAYLERIFQTLDEPIVINDKENACKIGRAEGRVTFENVTFSYDESGPNILENVSFDVEKGETIALVGPTGAGKSTIINLVTRFYDVQGGKVLIDGKDIKDITLKSLRSNMGIMLQESFLFSGTIADNIRYGKLNATHEEIVEAAKTVCAHDFISVLPDGYNTYVTEGGSSLSTGQRQLIAFARALLADPAILILDEATSSIDTETEMLLQKGLERLLKGRTSFVIAHRLSTIKSSSKIMYIQDKQIAECGTHDELIEKQGKYYNLYRAQYKFLEDL